MSRQATSVRRKANISALKGCSGVLTRSVELNSGKVWPKGTRVKVASVWRGKLSVKIANADAWIFSLNPSNFAPDEQPGHR